MRAEIAPQIDKLLPLGQQRRRIVRQKRLAGGVARIERRLLAHAVSERCIWADIDQIELDGADAAEFVDLRREGDLDQIAHADRRALRGGGEEDGLKALASASETQAQMLAAADLAQLQNAQPAHGEHRTRAARAAGFEVAQRLNLPFGVADLSLAPTPTVGDSVGEIFQTMGLSSIGAPGTTAILAMLNDAVKKGGVFASSHVGGLSGAFIPVSEDSAIEAAARSGALTMEKLEAMTSVCSVGLDMIAIPGDTSAATISGMIADEMAIGMINSKTTAVRIIPVPGKGVGEKAVFGGLLGEAAIIRVPGGDSTGFVKLGGRIPAPIHSLKN